MHDDDPAGWDDKNPTTPTGSPRHVVHANPPASGRSSRPARWGPFPNIWWASRFRRPPAGLRPRARRRKREEPNKQKRGHSACLSSLGPSRSSAYPLPRVFPEISFPGTEHRRAKHWSRSLGTASKISIMRRTGSRSAVWRLCVHRRTRA